ncbi:MAG: hypothetical protein ACRD1L_02295 [Terriglobales bacterium]
MKLKQLIPGSVIAAAILSCILAMIPVRGHAEVAEGTCYTWTDGMGCYDQIGWAGECDGWDQWGTNCQCLTFDGTEQTLSGCYYVVV